MTKIDSNVVRLVRRLVRSLKLGWACLATALTYVPLFLRGADAGARARWLQAACGRAIRVSNVDVTVTGPIPSAGLLVSNHLSYLDVLVLGAVTAGVFVSKYEVAHWPIFGWFARLGGTLFLRRERRSDVARVTDEMRQTLTSGLLLGLFPEGTSTDGRSLLPFRSSLLEPAVGLDVPVTIAHLRYRLNDIGDVGREVCYSQDETFAAHAWNLFGKRHIVAEVRFKSISGRASNRKELARTLQAEVANLGKG